MRPLQYNSGSDNYSEGDDGYAHIEGPPSGGWNDDLGINRIIKDKVVVSKLIQFANNKFRLNTVFSNLKINWTITPSASGWTHKARCPFPDHSDSSPSFCYNSKDDLFKCFGCSRGGKVVEFISALTGKSRLQVAQDLIDKLNLKDEDLICELDFVEETSDCYSDINIKFSEFVFDFYERNKNLPNVDKFIMDITWNLDTYIEKYFGQNIDEDSFSQRVEILKNRLLQWEKVNSR